MRWPLDASAPARLSDYFKAKASWHLSGMLGGAIWGTGAMANFVASRVHIVGPAVSYSIGQGATMVSACLGSIRLEGVLFCASHFESKPWLDVFLYFGSSLPAARIR